MNLAPPEFDYADVGVSASGGIVIRARRRIAASILLISDLPRIANTADVAATPRDSALIMTRKASPKPIPSLPIASTDRIAPAAVARKMPANTPATAMGIGGRKESKRSSSWSATAWYGIAPGDATD